MNLFKSTPKKEKCIFLLHKIYYLHNITYMLLLTWNYWHTITDILLLTYYYLHEITYMLLLTYYYLHVCIIYTIQQVKTIHAFAQHNCIFSMIDLINKSPIIKLRVTTCHNILSFVSSVKRDILDGYEYFCSMRNCYCAIEPSWLCGDYETIFTQLFRVFFLFLVVFFIFIYLL